MSPWLPKAVIATEDAGSTAIRHDPIGLARRVTNLRSGHVVRAAHDPSSSPRPCLSGAQPIAQNPRLCSHWLERHFTKTNLEIYLNRVYRRRHVWRRRRGTRYFGKSALARASTRRGDRRKLLKSADPVQSTRQGDRDPHRAGARPMVETGVDQHRRRGAKSGVGSAGALTHPGIRYFADWIADRCAIRWHVRPHLRVRTARHACNARRAAIVDVLNRRRLQDVVSQGAGGVTPMARCGDGRRRDYGESQFNRATQAQRQPGSAFKPFVYRRDRGGSSRRPFVDGRSRSAWWPHYTNKYLGESARHAGRSINTVAVRVAQRPASPGGRGGEPARHYLKPGGRQQLGTSSEPARLVSAYAVRQWRQRRARLRHHRNQRHGRGSLSPLGSGPARLFRRTRSV